MENRYWVSWYQPTEDYRPLIYPPTKILGWWCSGSVCDDNNTAVLVALLDAKDENQAKKILKEYWPETIDVDWRFFDLTEKNFVPNDRFPLPEWSSLKTK